MMRQITCGTRKLAWCLLVSRNRLLHWRNLWNQYDDGQKNLTRRREGDTEQCLIIQQQSSMLMMK
ncbi:hypothetical protein CWD78_12490 [Dickeya dadantii]|nr:hypothetical protein [Dickeya dadantii]